MSNPAPNVEAWPESVPLKPGRMLDAKYRLERLLGQGGMGSVWRARNVLLDLAVALKIVHPEARGSDACARLLTEARVEATLHHPNVVRVFDYGQSTQGEPYIVMELVEGKSLGEMLCHGGPLAPAVAVQLLLPVIDALCAAHAAGIIHRDLKPDNILVSIAGNQLRPKLVDFGIAKFGGRTPPRRLTRNGSVLGSPGYMAPEQARGDEVDARADVWGVCVVLYEAISGRSAFDAPDHEALIKAVQETEPLPLTAAEHQTLWPILSRGLAKDPTHRIATMQQLGNELAGWLVAQGVYEDAAGDPLSQRWPVPARTEPASQSAELRAFTERVERAQSSGAPLRSSQASSIARTQPHGSRPRRLRVPVAMRTSLFLAAGFGLGSWLFAWIQQLEDRHDELPVPAASVLRPAQAEAKLATDRTLPSGPVAPAAMPARAIEARGVSFTGEERETRGVSTTRGERDGAKSSKLAKPKPASSKARELLRESSPELPPAAPVRASVRSSEAELGLKKPW